MTASTKPRRSSKVAVEAGVPQNDPEAAPAASGKSYNHPPRRGGNPEGQLPGACSRSLTAIVRPSNTEEVKDA